MDEIDADGNECHSADVALRDARVALHADNDPKMLLLIRSLCKFPSSLICC